MAIDRRSPLRAGVLAMAPIASRAVASGACPSPDPAPIFSFGLAADIQSADKASAGPRHYRDSLAELEHCVDFWNIENLGFVIQLVDLVDTGGIPTLSRMFSIYAKARAKKYNVLGNHDFAASRDQVMQESQMPSAYYSFKVGGWRFIVLDAMNVSVDGGCSKDDPHFLEGQKINSALEKAASPVAGKWNGVAGEVQRRRLAHELADASAMAGKVIVFCHIPTLPGSCQPDLLLWDHDEVVRLLDTCPTLVACMCGHDHHGRHARRNGIHDTTFPGMVEHDAGDGSFVIDVHADRWVMRTGGRQPMAGQRKAFAFRAEAVASRQRTHGEWHA